MKLLLVLGDDDTYNHISIYIKPLGYEFIRYYNVLKAMDNIEEVNPTAIIISAQDFPRHWKTLVQFIRSTRSKDSCPIILLKGENFSVEESSKASYLGVSGIVSESLDNPGEVDRFTEILSRYIPSEEKRRASRYNPESWHRFNLVLSVPQKGTIVTGKIKSISSVGFSFLPDNPGSLRYISLNTEFDECSLRVGESILSPVCRLVRSGRIISMEFISFPGSEHQILDDYLEEIPQQDR